MLNLTRYAPLFILSFALFPITGALAQCAGVNTGGGNCVPPDAPGMPGYDSGPSAGSSNPYINRFGAMAYDTGSDIIGVAENMEDREEAESAALEDCRQQAGKACKSLGTYGNACIALARPDGTPSPISVGFDVNFSALAKRKAKKKCGNTGSDCEIVYSGCSKGFWASSVRR